MKAADIRRKYIEFFVSKGHKEIKSSSLIPDNDPTCLFTTAGMHPLVPYLSGEKHPLGTRLTDFQKCIRTGDIDEVGDPVHLTFFEMLGNWSLGDYFKEEAIKLSFEFLTGKDNLNIPVNMLAFTVLQGMKMLRLIRKHMICGRASAFQLTALPNCPKKITGGAPPVSPVPAVRIRKFSTGPVRFRLRKCLNLPINAGSKSGTTCSCSTSKMLKVNLNR